MFSEIWKKNLGQSRLDLSSPRPASWWTGQAPSGVMRSLPIPDLRTVSRLEAAAYFDNTWTLTDTLFAGLKSEEGFYRPPAHELRHPLIFYYAHPAVLYVNKLRIAEILTDPVDAEFESLFETGVDEMSWDDMSKNEMVWPPLDQVQAYRRKVYEIVRRIIAEHPGLDAGHPMITRDDPLWALFMGFEHERIHLETSSVLIRELPADLVQRSPFFPAPHESVARPSAPRPEAGTDYLPAEFARFAGGAQVIGKPTEAATFGWDNEYGRRAVNVGEFSATRTLICNGEFFAFVADGGYSDERYWSAEGWKWRTFRNAKRPTYWVTDGPAGSHRYDLRCVFEVVPMQWDWPAVVNFHEAQAFCRWRSEKDGVKASYRMVSEAEHHSLRQRASGTVNFELKAGSEAPVRLGGEGGTAVHDVFGNVWQWCEDHFHPLEGFKIDRLYDDFSTPCFDGAHQMILGGSFISTGDEATPWARFHFRRHFHQHAGFRLAFDSGAGNGAAVHLGEDAATRNVYETDDILNEYKMLHFGPAALQMPFEGGPREATEFPRRCAELVIAQADRLAIQGGRVLDIGCAVGGSTFALAKRFDDVLGIDLSASFITAARMVQESGVVSLRYREEGDIFTEVVFEVSAEERRRASFRRADACSLPAEFVDFDAVLIANVLCRLPSPHALLSRLSGPRGVVRRGGLLVITTPFTWMEKYAPRDVWLGGTVDDEGQPRWSEAALVDALSDQFELLERRDMPLVIREHRRKYQYIQALATVWKRR